MADAPKQMQMDSIDETKVTVWSACCCCYSGCLPDTSGLGCATQETLCCCELDLCLKAGTEPLCCGCCALRCVSPTVCIKQQTQCCCLVQAAALPCDAEVPCMVGCCCLNCYPSPGICVKVAEAKGQYASQA